MAGHLPYATVKQFYDVLVEYKNEDGYVVCTAQYAGKVAGVSQANVKALASRLQAMGVLHVYTARPKREDIRSGEFTLIKVTGTFTSDQYANYILGEFDRRYEERRKARLEKILPQ